MFRQNPIEANILQYYLNRTSPLDEFLRLESKKTKKKRQVK